MDVNDFVELITDIGIASIVVGAIILLLHILMAVLFANKIQDIADTKEYEGSLWGWTFFLTVVLSVVGMLISVLMLNALPNKEYQNKKISE